MTRWSDLLVSVALSAGLVGCTLVTNPSSFEQGPPGEDAGTTDAPRADTDGVDVPDRPDTGGHCMTDTDCGGVGLCEAGMCDPCECPEAHACIRDGDVNLCVACDVDDDGTLSADPACDALAAGRPRDCDDDGDGFEIVRDGICDGIAGPDCDDRNPARRPGFFESCEAAAGSFCAAPTESMAADFAGERWLRVGDAPRPTEPPSFSPPLGMEAREGEADEWFVLSAGEGTRGVTLRHLELPDLGETPVLTEVEAMTDLVNEDFDEVFYADIAQTLGVVHIGMTGRKELNRFVRIFQMDGLAFTPGRRMGGEVEEGPIAVSHGIRTTTARVYHYRRTVGGNEIAWVDSNGGNNELPWTTPPTRPIAAAQEFAVVPNGERFAIWHGGDLSNIGTADGPTVKLLPIPTIEAASEHILVFDGCGGADPPRDGRCGDVHRVVCNATCVRTVQGRLTIPAPDGLPLFGVTRMPGAGASLAVAHGVAAPGGLRVVVSRYDSFEPAGEVTAFDGLVFERVDAIDLESRYEENGIHELTLAVHSITADDLGGVYVQVFRYCPR